MAVRRGCTAYIYKFETLHWHFSNWATQSGPIEDRELFIDNKFAIDLSLFEWQVHHATVIVGTAIKLIACSFYLYFSTRGSLAFLWEDADWLTMAILLEVKDSVFWLQCQQQELQLLTQLLVHMTWSSLNFVLKILFSLILGHLPSMKSAQLWSWTTAAFIILKGLSRWFKERVALSYFYCEYLVHASCTFFCWQKQIADCI